MLEGKPNPNWRIDTILSRHRGNSAMLGDAPKRRGCPRLDAFLFFREHNVEMMKPYGFPSNLRNPKQTAYDRTPTTAVAAGSVPFGANFWQPGRRTYLPSPANRRASLPRDATHNIYQAACLTKLPKIPPAKRTKVLAVSVPMNPYRTKQTLHREWLECPVESHKSPPSPRGSREFTQIMQHIPHKPSREEREMNKTKKSNRS